MAKEQGIPYRGRILEVLPSGHFRVQAPDDIIVLATVANRARRDLRHLAVGEAVRIEVTPYDRHRGGSSPVARRKIALQTAGKRP